MGDREKEVSVGEKIREKYDRCSSFLTVAMAVVYESHITKE